MQVVASQLAMVSQHRFAKSEQVTGSVEAWTDGSQAATAVTSKELLSHAMGLLPASLSAEDCSSAQTPEQSLSRKDAVKLLLLERLFGLKNAFGDGLASFASVQGIGTSASLAPTENPVAAEGPQRQGWGLRMNLNAHSIETESLDIGVSGIVETADGRRFEIAASLHWERRIEWNASYNLRLGDAALDPLVLSTGGQQPVDANQTAGALDLTGDGIDELLPKLSAGTAFLGLDRNGNETVDDRSELFGPQSGNGFAELAALDSDGNGWVDAADKLWQQLILWRPDAPSQTLTQAGVGAIATSPVKADFTARRADGQAAAYARQSSLWLGEDGQTGYVHRVDVAA
jgi:hypothetical protein